MSLMPLRQSNGLASVDVGYYYSMSRPAQEVNLQCIQYKEQGGYTHVGKWALWRNLFPTDSALEYSL